MRKGDFQEAINLFERAIKTGEFIDELYSYLGDAHLKTGNKEAACDAWRKGAEQNEIQSKQRLDQNCD